MVFRLFKWRLLLDFAVKYTTVWKMRKMDALSPVRVSANKEMRKLTVPELVEG
jgi:hypothetical protein